MCKSRCSAVSWKPNTIVAVVRMPSSMGGRMTSSHSLVLFLNGLIRLRISSSRISAPPPGSESMPAACSRASTSRMLRSSSCAMWMISVGESACREAKVLLGPAKQVLVPVEASSGLSPPCKQDLHAAEILGLAELLRPAVPETARSRRGLRGRGVEVAELAARHADVGVVDVAIDDVGDHAIAGAGRGGGGRRPRPAPSRRRSRTGRCPRPGRGGPRRRRARAGHRRRGAGRFVSASTGGDELFGGAGAGEAGRASGLRRPAPARAKGRLRARAVKNSTRPSR
jgi:hypothetical protein